MSFVSVTAGQSAPVSRFDAELSMTKAGAKSVHWKAEGPADRGSNIKRLFIAAKKEPIGVAEEVEQRGPHCKERDRFDFGFEIN